MGEIILYLLEDFALLAKVYFVDCLNFLLQCLIKVFIFFLIILWVYAITTDNTSTNKSMLSVIAKRINQGPLVHHKVTHDMCCLNIENGGSSGHEELCHSSFCTSRGQGRQDVHGSQKLG